MTARKSSLQLFAHSTSGVLVMIEGFAVVVSAAATASKAERARTLNFMLNNIVARNDQISEGRKC